MSDQKLMTHFRFDESELHANRSGRISEKQKERLQIKESGAKIGSLFLGGIFMLSALLGLGIGGFAVFGDGPASESLAFRIIMGSVFGCIWTLIWGAAGIFTLQRAFAKMEIKVAKAEGQVNILKVIRREYNSSTETYSDRTAYELRLGGRTFDVRAETPNFMTQGDVFAVYFADFNLKDKKKEILSAELISKGSGSYTPQPVAMQDAEVVEFLKKGDVLRAIRAHRTLHGTNLEDAKDAVDDIQARLRSE